MDGNSIQVKNVTKRFRLKRSLFQAISGKGNGPSEIVALKDVSFEVKKGEFMTIIGLNGSGKTTLLRTIAGIYQPDSGSVNVNGFLAPILQIGSGFHNELNAEENIMMSGMLLGISKSEIKSKINDIIEFAELEDFVNMKLKHYSSGMRARLAFSTTLQIDPDIMLIDEVLAVGDKKFKEKSFQAFTSFKERKKTILLVTHSLEKAVKMSDRMMLMHKGEILSIGEPDKVIDDYEKLTSNSKNTKI